MKLNTRAQTAQSPNNNSPIVLVHGLFGSLDNLGVLARDLVTDHEILQVDMRNHGLSGRSEEMTYAAMAQDLRDTLDANNIQKATLIGHSMGGKAVMALTALAPERISGLVVIDVAPVNYDVRRHDEILPPSMRSPKRVSQPANRRLPLCASILMKKAWSSSC